jgi:glycosyltransferase involved in cell wall biosynthesis
MVERIVVSSPGGWQSPSARYRLGPLAREGPWPVEVVSGGSFPTRAQIDELLRRKGKEALLILQRVMPTREEVEDLKVGYRNVLFDFDDAIYEAPPDSDSPPAKLLKNGVRLLMRGSPSASARKRPLVRTLEQVDLCVAGNAILRAFAQRHAGRVVEIPTTVKPVEAPPPGRPLVPVVVWMGLPDNLRHLRLTRGALEQLSAEFDFRLRIVSSEPWSEAPVPAEFVAWSPEAMRETLLGASVGIAPLADTPWTRGKCALRAIQYGGHALPTVASPVGVTDRVVLHGKTGYLADGEDEWFEALRTLISNRDLGPEMGRMALDHVRAHYSDTVAGSAWRDAVKSL